MWYLAVYERTRNAISRRLREKTELDISSYTREVQEMRNLAVYEKARNAIIRPLW
jgi:hypothetical protein